MAKLLRRGADRKLRIFAPDVSELAPTFPVQRRHLLRFGSWERWRESSGQVIDPEKWVIPWENSNDAALLDLERHHEAKKLLGGVAPLALVSLLSVM